MRITRPDALAIVCAVVVTITIAVLAVLHTDVPDVLKETVVFLLGIGGGAAIPAPQAPPAVLDENAPAAPPALVARDVLPLGSAKHAP